MDKNKIEEIEKEINFRWFERIPFVQYDLYIGVIRVGSCYPSRIQNDNTFRAIVNLPDIEKEKSFMYCQTLDECKRWMEDAAKEWVKKFFNENV